MRICIATTDIVGPIRNGGVGTAYTALAENLADAGHSVSILYCSTYYEQHDRKYVEEMYWRQGICFTDLSGLEHIRLSFQPSLSGPATPVLNAYLAYTLLKDANYDVIHFPDYIGTGFYCAMAKATGVAFGDTLLVVTGHGPTMWSAFTNDTPIDHPNLLYRDALERGMIANADVLVTPNFYMKEWMSGAGYRLPAHHVRISGLLPSRSVPTLIAPLDRRGEKVEELVFYGRIESRKGIWQFLDALDELNSKGLLTGKRVAFLGKCVSSSLGVSKHTIGLRAQTWDFEWHLADNYDTFEAMEYIRQAGRLAVMPSTCDNSPYAILEALTNGVPFIATAVGGVPELVHEESHREVLVPATSQDLAGRLERALLEGAPVARPAERLEDVKRAWVDFHETNCAELLRGEPSPRAKFPQETVRTVSVCIVHRDRPDYLHQAILSARQQTYPSVEVIVVDNGSTKPAALDYLQRLEESIGAGVKVVRRTAALYPDKARNVGVSSASGDYVVFLDDDNMLKPEAVSTYVSAIETGKFDIVVSCLDFFNSRVPPLDERQVIKRQLFVGDTGVIGLFQNTIGDTNLVVARKTFEELGGFDDVGFFAPVEDWRFLARAKRLGLRIGVIPEALIWYRQETNVWDKSWRKRNQHGARRQALESLVGGRSYDEKLWISMAQGLFHRVLELDAQLAAAQSPPKE